MSNDNARIAKLEQIAEELYQRVLSLEKRVTLLEQAQTQGTGG